MLGERAVFSPFLLSLFPVSAQAGYLTLSFKKEGGEVFHVRISRSADGELGRRVPSADKRQSHSFALAGGYSNDGDPRTFPTLEELALSKPKTLKTPLLVGEI
jgi:hypothetical protein